jgi:hypothetical protein
MSIEILLFVIVLVFVFGLLARKRTEYIETKNKTEDDIQESDLIENNDNYNKMEELFFQEISNGKERYRFLIIDNQFDLMFVKSLFQSENIPYYIEFEHVSSIRPGMFVGDLGNYNVLYILDEDYHDAIKVIKNYIETKRKNTEPQAAENARNLAEIIVMNWRVPSANDMNGIHVIYKNSKPTD